MRRYGYVFTVAFAGLFVIALAVPTIEAEEPMASGADLYSEYKCGMCHAVASAGIEAKIKSDSMKGPDLGAYKTEMDAETLLSYLVLTDELDGKKHKKKYAGTPEELTVIMAWLEQLEPAK